MNDKKFTDEFPPEIKPFYRGVYRTRMGEWPGYSRWTGTRWSNQCDSAAYAKTASVSGAEQRKFWRGLAEKPV